METNMNFQQAFFDELEKVALDTAKAKSLLKNYGPYAATGAGLGALIGALKGRSDAMSYVTYHKLSEEDKKKMRRARMLSGAAAGGATGLTLGLGAKKLLGS